MMTTPAFGGQQAPAFGGQQGNQTTQGAFGGGQQAPAASGSPFLTASQAPTHEQGDSFTPAELVGAVLIFEALEYVTGLTTSFTKAGETTDMVRCNITVVGASNASGSWQRVAPEQSTVLKNSGVFQGRLIGKLKGSVGVQPILGKLKTEPTSGNPAYDLEDPSPEEYQQALAAWNATKSGPPF